MAGYLFCSCLSLPSAIGRVHRHSMMSSTPLLCSGCTAATTLLEQNISRYITQGRRRAGWRQAADACGDAQLSSRPPHDRKAEHYCSRAHKHGCRSPCSAGRSCRRRLCRAAGAGAIATLNAGMRETRSARRCSCVAQPRIIQHHRRRRLTPPHPAACTLQAPLGLQASGGTPV